MAIALVGTVLAGVLLLVVVLAIARGIDWRSGDYLPDREEASLAEALAASPAAWVAAFLAVALGLPAVAILAVGGFGLSVPAALPATVAAFGFVALAYLVAGTYAAVRDREGSPASATLITALLVGGLLLVAVSGTLLLG